MSTRTGWRAIAQRGMLGVLVLVVAATPTAAQEATQREHVVRRGDTLWDLARIYLSNPFLWPSIYEANRAGIRDPHWIYPDQRFVIPPVIAADERDWAQPRAQPLGVAVVTEIAAHWPEAEAEAEAELEEAPTVLEAELETHMIVRPAEYRSAPWLSQPQDLHAVGRIVGLADPAAAHDRLPSTMRPYDRLHIGSLRVAVAPGDTLLIARVGRNVANLGRLVEPLGLVHVEGLAAGVAQVRLVRQFGDVRVGDVALALEAVPALPETIGAAVDAVGGTLVDFLDARSIYGASEYGFVNVGRAHGIGIGDELVVSTAGVAPTRRRPDGVPAEDIARVRVIRVEGATATVRVLSVNTTVLAPGLPVRRVRMAS